MEQITLDAIDIQLLSALQQDASLSNQALAEKDTITPLAQAQRIVSLSPQASLVVMPGIGHIPQIENGVDFNALLVQQLTLLTP